MKKLWSVITEKRISITMLAVFMLSLLPIVILAFYNYPCADDLSASDSVRLAWLNTGSILAVIKAAWENVVFNYMEWSGVFMSVFWTSMQPGIFGENFYWITTVLALVFLVEGAFYLGHTVFAKYLKADRYTGGCIIVLFLFTLIHCMPEGNEGLYWHAGVVNYTWAYAFLLMLLGTVLSLYQEKNKTKKIIKSILACILAVCVGGGNYLTALQGSIWLLSVVAIGCMVSCRKKRIGIGKMVKENIVGILPMVVILISFAISVLAPGNRVRMSAVGGMNPVKAVLVSFHYFLNDPIEEWLTWPVLVLLALAIPFMWHMAEKSTFEFHYPGVVAFIGFCMASAAFTPNLYAQGDVGGGRLADTIFFIWVFWLYVVAFYVVGWFAKTIGMVKTKQEGLSIRSKIYVVGMVFFWVLCSGLTIMVDEGTYIGTLAGYSVITGQAEIYKQQNEDRLELLYNEEIDNVVFRDFSNPPELLMFQDITKDANDWLNQVMAEYYGKESVRRD